MTKGLAYTKPSAMSSASQTKGSIRGWMNHLVCDADASAWPGWSIHSDADSSPTRTKPRAPPGPGESGDYAVEHMVMRILILPGR